MTTTERLTEELSYCDSVMQYADHWGFLSQEDAEKLLADHGSSPWQALEEGLEIHHLRHARALLIHLGY